MNRRDFAKAFLGLVATSFLPTNPDCSHYALLFRRPFDMDSVTIHQGWVFVRAGNRFYEDALKKFQKGTLLKLKDLQECYVQRYLLNSNNEVILNPKFVEAPYELVLASRIPKNLPPKFMFCKDSVEWVNLKSYTTQCQ